MWKTLFKLGLAYAFSTQMKAVVGQRVLPAVGQYAAATRAGVAHGLSNDWKRVLNSIIWVVVSLMTLVLSSVAGMVWFLVWAINHPQREWLFAGALVVPLLIAVFSMMYLKSLWKNRGVLNDTQLQLQQQWHLFKQQFK